MTREEIAENNKIIAKFMGFKYLNQEEYAKQTGCPKEELINMPLCNCFYRSSWDWLMPCIGKISNQCEEPEELDPLKYALLTNNIEEAFIFVVDYLKEKQ